MLNHTCDGHAANALKLVLDFLGGTMLFMASRDVPAGEELCHRYFDVEGSAKSRHQHSMALGFTCACRRCSFEANRLTGTAAAAAVEAARTEFRGRLLDELRVVWASPPTAGANGSKRAVAAAPPRLLREVLELTRSVERSAAAQDGWGPTEVAWCLALIQPISNAAFSCLLNRDDDAGGDGGGEFGGLTAVELRCEVLERIVAAWRHTESYGYDHLRNAHFLWSALDEVRMRAVASAAVEARPARVSEDGAGTAAGGALWPRMCGAEFFEAVRSRGLGPLLRQAGGFMQVVDLLPHGEAVAALEALGALPEEDWVLSASQNSHNADHRFWRYEGSKLDELKRSIEGLVPGMHPILNAARYDKGGKITLHNDASKWVVQSKEVADRGGPYPAGTELFRKIAVILYLTDAWKEEYGGCLVDNLSGGPRLIVPKFNSLVAFLVPREHWVTEVAEGAPLRYTLFGWFHDAEPYPQGCPPPLGTGNQRPEGDRADEAEQAPLTGAAAEAAAACEAVRRAKEQCEHAFRMRFGIAPEDLRLGQADSQANGLLRRLKGAP